MSSLSRTRRNRALLFGGFAAGLLLRAWMLSYKGTFDMDTNARWGRAVLHDGLARAYDGNYFPLAYQLFGLCEWIASRLGVDPIPVYKAENLIFDAGSFWVLVGLLRKTRGGRLYALLYWLHPWFLSVFSLGYVDSHFTLCVLLWLWLVRDAATPPRYFLAGIPLALALMMKPQAVLPLAAVLFYLWFTRRDPAIGARACVLAPAVLVFGLYEIYFTAALFATEGAHAMLLLPTTYVRIGSIQPVLTAHMPNIWYLAAIVLRSPGEDVWNVSSKLHVVPFVQIRFFALAVTVAAIAWYARVLARARSLPIALPFLYLTTFTSVIVPALMTSAHENHLFLATALLIPILATKPGLAVSAAIHGIFLLQFLNVELIYGVDTVAQTLRPGYSPAVRLVVAILSVALTGIVVWKLYATAVVSQLRPPVVA